jgi:hypothetical protein
MAFEAEAMTLISPMTVGQNAAASNSRFASVSTGASDGDCNVSRPGGAAIQQFTTTAPGTYRIWARTLAVNSGQDSMCVSLDGGPGINWSLPIDANWRWSVVATFNSVQLPAGAHTLRFRVRELNAKLDRVIVTNDLNFVPTGLGILPTYSPLPTPTIAPTVSPLPSPTRTPTRVITATPSATLTPPPTATRTPMPASGTFVFEAESAQIAAPMVVANDPAARNGKFVWVPGGATYDCNTAITGASATFTVTITRAGTYRIWARTISPNTGSDSFCLKIATTAQQTWSLPVRTNWGWSVFKSPVGLDPGTYQIQIRLREPRAKLDQLVITDNANYTPQ